MSVTEIYCGIPKVSIVIPMYNKGQYIERTLRSVVDQSFASFEILVVDDGSTDGGAELVRGLADKRIRLITQENAGASAARNRGILEARADYVAFLDADDEWRPQYLATLWRLKSDFPQGRLFGTSYEIIYEDGQRVVPDLPFPEISSITLMQYIESCLKNQMVINASAVMVHKPLLEKVGMFPVGQRRAEDLDTWFRLLSEEPVIYFNKPLMTYWYGLPCSACLVINDVYLKANRLLDTLEENLERGVYQNGDRERIIDYIAWYMLGPVDRLIAAGMGAEARRHTLAAFRSKRFRMKYAVRYLESFLPRWICTRSRC